MEAKKLFCIRNRGGVGTAKGSEQGIYILTCLSLAGSEGHISPCTNGETRRFERAPHDSVKRGEKGFKRCNNISRFELGPKLS